MGNILEAWFGSTCHLKGNGLQVNTKLFKVITLALGWNIPILIGVFSSRVVMIWITSFRSHHITAHLNSYWKFRQSVDHQNTKWGKIIGKNGVHPSRRVGPIITYCICALSRDIIKFLFVYLFVYLIGFNRISVIRHCLLMVILRKISCICDLFSVVRF